METTLELRVRFSPPQAGSPPGAIALVDVYCDQLGLAHLAEPFIDPLAAQERALLEWYLEEYWRWPYGEYAEQVGRVEDLLADIGQRLYRAAFRNVESIVQAWRLQPGVRLQLSIGSEAPEVLSLPWELLHDERGFLVLRTPHPIALVRSIPLSSLVSYQGPVAGPLRVLVVTPHPSGINGGASPRAALAVLEAMREAVEEGVIEVEFLRPRTLGALRQRLGDTRLPEVHILHYEGAGQFQAATSAGGVGRGILAFETEKGDLDAVEGERFAQVLNGSGVRMVVLNASQGVQVSSADAFAGVAARLVQGGVNVVIALSATLLASGKARYVGAFYQALGRGETPAVANERARQALHDDPLRFQHRRSRDDSGTPVSLRDWWVPHFYQQRPLLLSAGQAARKQKKAGSALTPAPFNPRHAPPDAPCAFTGRVGELFAIERELLRGRLVVLTGPTGIGKTALASEAAAWLTQTGMYGAACFVSCERGADAGALVSALADALGAPLSRVQTDLPGALAHLRSALRSRSRSGLLVLDHLESVLPAGSAALDDRSRSQFWGVLLDLQAMGVGIIVTSTRTDFGDGRMAAGRTLSQQHLGGLLPADAQELAMSLLDAHAVAGALVPQAPLRELLGRLGYHPQAMVRVLPVLRSQSLSSLQADFAALVPPLVGEEIWRAIEH